jgi:hypothetical protein
MFLTRVGWEPIERARFDKLPGDLEKAVSENPRLSGKEFSLPHIGYAPSSRDWIHCSSTPDFARQFRGHATGLSPRIRIPLAVRSREADEISLKLEYLRLKSNETHVLNWTCSKSLQAQDGIHQRPFGKPIRLCG